VSLDVPTGPAAPADLLRRHGLQVTAQRLAVLRAVAANPHGTADEVEAQVRDEIGTVSRQAVYDALSALTEKGVIRRIQPARSPARYEDRVDDNHHHLVCRLCGRVVDVECAAGTRPCLDTVDDHGFVIDEAEVLYWGICPTCRGSTPRSTRPAKSKRSTPATTSPSGAPS
jgi:Fur family ferric uptake transcriptional regulator